MTYPYLKRLPAFEYLAPETIEEALELLARYGDEARLLAGGTDLLMNMKRRSEVPKYVIGLKNVRGLDFFSCDEAEGLRFGPLVTVRFIETWQLVREKFPVLAQGAAALGSMQVRNLATVVGNLCSALPSADTAPGLIVLGAELAIRGPNVERRVAVEDFFTGPGESVLAPDEIVVSVHIPNPSPGSGMAYLTHTARSAMDLSLVGVAALLVPENGVCRQARLCLGTAGPIPMRARAAEAVLQEKPLTASVVDEAAEAASRNCRPRSSRRASAGYRREMVRVLTRRALRRAWETAGK